MSTILLIAGAIALGYLIGRVDGIGRYHVATGMHEWRAKILRDAIEHRPSTIEGHCEEIAS